MEKTKTVVRAWPKSGHIIALFPEINATYSRECNMDREPNFKLIINNTREASDKEGIDMLTELNNNGMKYKRIEWMDLDIE